MRISRIVALVSASLASICLAAPDPERGAEILRRKQCTACHSILGVGPDRAPDLGFRRSTAWQPTAFTALLWNHGPRMWEEMALLDAEVPELSEQEVRELYEYMSSLWRYDPIGVASYGNDVWIDLQCYRCHPIVGDEQGIGSPVSSWRTSPNSVDWIRQMWNHASIMADEFDREEGVWPVFTLQHFVDLMAYVENIDQLNAPDPVVLPRDLTDGRRLFREASCESCHTIGQVENQKVDLAPAARETTLAQMAVEMWNHAPVMSTSPSVGQVETPRLERGEMAAVLAYVSAQAQRELGGDPDRGGRVFEVKHCAVCHSPSGEAPSLTARNEPYSLISLSTSVWRHGPDMLDEMRLSRQDWPELTPQDVADLLAHFNQ